MNIDNSKPSYFKRVFTGRSGIIFIIAAAAFIFLNVYRFNDPIDVGMDAPDIELTTHNGEKFKLSEIISSKVLIFYKKHTYFSNYIMNTAYKKELASFNILQDKGTAQVIVIVDGFDSVEEINELLKDEDYSAYKDIIFATDTKAAGKKYGVRSWPHLFVLSRYNKVIYQTKIGSADKVQQVLWRD